VKVINLNNIILNMESWTKKNYHWIPFIAKKNILQKKNLTLWLICY